MFHVEVFWVVTPYRVVVGYQRFGGPCCLHLHGEVKMAPACTSETLVLTQPYTASQPRRPRFETSNSWLYNFLQVLFISFHFITFLFLSMSFSILCFRTLPVTSFLQSETSSFTAVRNSHKIVALYSRIFMFLERERKIQYSELHSRKHFQNFICY